MRTTQHTVFLLLAISSLALPASAQEPARGQEAATIISGDLDARWLPWMGCWQIWEEQIARDADNGFELPERTVVCMTPTDDGAGVMLTASAADEVLVERTLVANGARRDVTDGECTGWERRDWSADGQRLFTRAELTCGPGAPRRMSGISFLATRSIWVDIQLVNVGEHRHLEIRRYNPASEADELPVALPASLEDIREARQASAAPLTLPGVREAAAKADPRVVEALLTETEPRLSIDSATLIELDDAGIDGGVIDLLVALAYPEHFVVERRRSRGGGGGGGGWGTGWGGGGFYDPIWYGDLYPYYLAPLGYGAWGRGYDPYFYGGGSPFIGIRGDVAEPSGRVINGLGYTRVQSRTAVSRGATASGSGSGSNGASTGTQSGNSGGGGGGGRVTSGGYTRSGGGGGGGGNTSGGGGGGNTSGGGGRTAVPRR